MCRIKIAEVRPRPRNIKDTRGKTYTVKTVNFTLNVKHDAFYRVRCGDIVLLVPMHTDKKQLVKTLRKMLGALYKTDSNTPRPTAHQRSSEQQ